MKRILSLITILAALPLRGAENEGLTDDDQGDPARPAHIYIGADTRFDFDYDDYADSPHSSGFHGKYLNVILDANINSQLSVHLRQRLNKFGEMKNDVFGATDWVYLNYSPIPELTLSGGKQVVAIGGFEYDRNPINIYYASMFWNNIACYQFGVSATWNFDSGNQHLMGQVCNSPYQAIGNSCYSYNLMWSAKKGCYSALWSANLVEYRPDRYGFFLALGNRIDFNGFYAELDLMNRYSGHQRFLFDDYSIIAKACATVGHFDIFAKGGYEHYRPVLGEKPTTDKPFYGAGVEFFPLKGSRNLRLHVVADVTHDSFTGERRTNIGAGLMWRVTLLNK